MSRFEVEYLSADALRSLQSGRLQETLRRVTRAHAPFWQQKLSGAGMVDSVDEIRQLPFTDKAEFRDVYPYGMLAVPREDVVRVHASSGTSGKPTIVAYTRDDVGVFAEVNARALALAGGGPGDVVHVAYGYGLFTGGLGLHYGVEALGAVAVPASGGNVGFQLGMLADLGATGLACTPSFALLLAERAAEAGVVDQIKLRWGVHGAEAWSEGLRAKLEAAWGGEYDACDIYGLSEVIGPGVAQECYQNKGGLHVMEDHFYPEIVDPVTGDPVAEGDPGELVLTSLTKQAQPVIRYRTRDITRLLRGECPCGRTTRRIGRLEGRADDMLIIRGVNVYPRQIESVLMDDPDLGAQFAIIIDRRGTLPEVEARVELRSSELVGRREEIAARLEERLIEAVRLRIRIDVGDPGSIPRTEAGKVQRVYEQTTDRDPLS
ncbi:MAG TPA: phenylacetate--CoA ligase [Acidimicrobiia bacterium]|jgi:phenylacetate-CoA ligase|nr:phenylacetate--CoA ligase [Acidimicrobiia bacterium]